MIIKLTVAGLMLIAGAASVWLIVGTRDRHWFQRCWMAMVPPAAAAILLMLLSLGAMAVTRPLSSLRVVATLMLFNGDNPYSSLTQGDLLTTIYPPGGYAAYFPVLLGWDPLSVMIIGALTSIGYYMLPPLLLSIQAWRRTGNRWQRWLIASCLGVFTAYLVIDPATRSHLGNVYVDTPALGLAAIATWLVMIADGKRRTPCLIASAILAIAACWAKQIAVPVALALPVYLFLARGHRSAMGYLLIMVIAGTIISGLWIGTLGYDRLSLHLIQLPARHRWIVNGYTGPMALALAFSFIWIAIWPALTMLAALAGIEYWLDQQQSSESAGNWFDRHRWSALLIVGLCLITTSTLARVKVEGLANSFFCHYFFLLALLALAQHLITRNDLQESTRKLVEQLFTFTAPPAMALITIACLQQLIILPAAIEQLDQFPEQQAYEALKAHPGQIYFPWHPVANYLAEDRCYNQVRGIVDWHLAELPLDAERFNQGLPANLRYFALRSGSDGFRIRELHLPDFKYKTKLDALPGWHIWTNRPPTTRRAE